MEDRGWRMEDGGWRMEDGGWRMEDGDWRMEMIGGRSQAPSRGRALRGDTCGRMLWNVVNLRCLLDCATIFSGQGTAAAESQTCLGLPHVDAQPILTSSRPSF